MVFGLQKLQDNLFCMTEERNYFQGKYLEQVSEIAALKGELRKARREILKLRGELMESSAASLLVDNSLNDLSALQTPPKNNRRRSSAINEHQEEKKDPDCPDNGNDSNSQHLPSEDLGQEENVDDDGENDEEDEPDDDDHTEAADIRQSAEKLLQWASYRSYARTSTASSPDQGSVASGPHATELQNEASLLDPIIPRAIDSTSLNNVMSGDSGKFSHASDGSHSN